MDSYKVLGTNKEIVYHMSLKESESKVDQFIREKYEYAKKRLEGKKKNAILPVDIKNLEQQIAEVVEAYEQVKSSIARACYRQEIDKVRKDSLGGVRQSIAKESAYKVLMISEISMKMRTDAENDVRIKKQKDDLIEAFSFELAKTTSFSQKERIKLRMKKIEESYQLIDTADKRREYERKMQEEERERKLKEKYSHILECSENLISNGTTLDGKCLDNKMVMRRNGLPQEWIYFNRLGQELKIRQTAVILFRDWMGLNCSDLNEYEVNRSVNGNERTDIVYSSLIMTYLSTDRKTGEAINPDYYNCVMNQLLSDDVIDGTKYNGGYIGQVVQDEKGNYYPTIEEEKLSPMEQEKLTAVMIMKRRKEKLRENNEEKDK